MDVEVCAEKHKRVDGKIQHHEGWLKDHEQKIDRLDRSDATNTEAIGNLCEQISGQIKAIWGLVVSITSVFVSFFIWYIQSLGGK